MMMWSNLNVIHVLQNCCSLSLTTITSDDVEDIIRIIWQAIHNQLIEKSFNSHSHTHARASVDPPHPHCRIIMSQATTPTTEGNGEWFSSRGSLLFYLTFLPPHVLFGAFNFIFYGVFEALEILFFVLSPKVSHRCTRWDVKIFGTFENLFSTK